MEPKATAPTRCLSKGELWVDPVSGDTRQRRNLAFLPSQVVFIA